MVRAEGRAGLVECRARTGRCVRRSSPRTHLLDLRVDCHDTPSPLVHRLRHRTRREQSAPRGGVQAGRRRIPAKRRVFLGVPAKRRFPARFALLASHRIPHFRARTLSTCHADPRHRRLRLRRRGARPAPAARRPRGARLRALARARRRAGRRRPRRSATRSTGAGLDEALDGVDVAYYLIHSMEGARRRRSPSASAARRERFARRRARRRRARGSSTSAGCVPADGAASRHLASRLAVEEALLDAAPESIALRASIVIGARSRSFRFLVRLIERLPVLAAARLAREPHAADRRPRRARVPARAPRPRRRALAGRVVGHRRPGRDDLRRDDRADRRRHAGRARPSRRAQPDAHAAGRGRGRRDRRRGPGADRPADGRRSSTTCCRATTRPPRRSACACTRFDAAVERALRDWEGDEELAAR